MTIFCKNCKKELSESEKPCLTCGCAVRVYKMICGSEYFETTLNRTKLTHKRPGVKQFLKQVIVGWMPTKGKKRERYPKGVFVSRIIDKENDWYEEKIVDKKTDEIIEDKKEPLSQHKSKR
jgi:hypothetical protein